MTVQLGLGFMLDRAPVSWMTLGRCWRTVRLAMRLICPVVWLPLCTPATPSENPTRRSVQTPLLSFFPFFFLLFFWGGCFVFVLASITSLLFFSSFFLCFNDSFWAQSHIMLQCFIYAEWFVGWCAYNICKESSTACRSLALNTFR